VKYIEELNIEELVDAVFEQVSSDWDWLGYEVDERVKYSLRERLRKAVKARANALHDEYVEELEGKLAETRSELERLETEGNPDHKLRRELEDRDRLVKRLILDLSDDRTFQTEEERYAETDQFTLVLAYNDGHPSAEVLDDEELKEKDLSDLGTK